jgi:hypothetical protein
MLAIVPDKAESSYARCFIGTALTMLIMFAHRVLSMQIRSLRNYGSL